MESKVLDPDFPVFVLKSDDDAYSLVCEMEPSTDTQGREYEMITQTIADEDFYQGLNMVSVIRRKADGKEFGYFWWDDISKHGEPYIEPNGDEYDIQQPKDMDDDDFDFTFGWVDFYVFVPVEPYLITSYKAVNDER